MSCLNSTVVVATLAITFSCQKSNHGDDPSDSRPEYVTAGISGRVVDDANQPVNAAAVKVGTATATTDINRRRFYMYESLYNFTLP